MTAELCRSCGSSLNGQPSIAVAVTLREDGRPDTPITTLYVHARCFAATALSALAATR